MPPWQEVPPITPGLDLTKLPVERMRKVCVAFFEECHRRENFGYLDQRDEVLHGDAQQVRIVYRKLRWARLIMPIAEERGDVVDAEVEAPALPAPEGEECA